MSYDKEINAAIRGMKNIEEDSNSPRVKMNCTFARLALQKQVQLNELLEYWKTKDKYEMILVNDLIDILEELKID